MIRSILGAASSLDGKYKDFFDNFSILALRVFFGGSMMVAHGWGKLSNFGSLSDSFPDPLGIGSSFLSLSLAVFAEFFCSLFIVCGILTRLSAIPLMVTMCVAAFIIHSNDPFQRKELALVYLVVFFVLFLRGGGRFSVDSILSKSR